jgi:hypothetical protein
MMEKNLPEGRMAEIKNRIMEKIKTKKIQMRSPFVFMAEKLGLESALVTAIIFGALLVSITFYFLKKTGILKFLSLGAPGFKVFLLTLPYDYIVLFIVTLVLAIYFANKIELFCGSCEHGNTFGFYLFLGALILGFFFAAMGVGHFFKGWSKNKIPDEMAIQGRVKNISSSGVVIQDESGNLITILLPVSYLIPRLEDEEGKFLRAVGIWDKNNNKIFHAEKVRCCDND